MQPQLRFLTPLTKPCLKAAPPEPAFGADADNLFAIVSGITPNLLMAFNPLKGILDASFMRAMMEIQQQHNNCISIFSMPRALP